MSFSRHRGKEMNFIRDKELALRFQSNSVPSQERFFYFIFTIILTMIISSPVYMFAFYSSPLSKWHICIHVLSLVIVIVGTIFCYRSNKSGDDKEFIERYISIAFPTGIRTFFIMLPAGLLFYGAIALFRETGLPHTASIYDFIWQAIFLGYFYWRLNSLIKLASH